MGGCVDWPFCCNVLCKQVMMMCCSLSSRRLLTKAWTVSVELCPSAWWLARSPCWWWLQLAFLQSVAIVTGSHAWLWKCVLILQPAQRNATLPQCRWLDTRIQLTSTLSRLAVPLHEQLVNFLLSFERLYLFPPVVSVVHLCVGLVF